MADWRKQRMPDDASEESMFGVAGEHIAWKAVMDLYRLDRLDGAFQAASELGAGLRGRGLSTFRMIEAEHMTRQLGIRQKVADWLEIEAVESESGSLDQLAEIARSQFEAVLQRMGGGEKPPTLLTVMALEADAPWAPYRHGFCTPKAEFSKICLPGALVHYPGQFQAALRHEFAHAIIETRATDPIPTWLHEACAMRMGEGPQTGSARQFRLGLWPWLDPATLNRAFQDDRTAGGPEGQIWRAYQQAAWLGEWIAGKGGDEAFGALLRELSHTTWLEGLGIVNPMEAAMKKSLGVSVEEAFALAKSAIR